MTKIRVPRAAAVVLIAIYTREYQELAENWSTLEKKAQLTAALCGALLSFSATLLFGKDSPIIGVVRVMTIGVSVIIAISAIYALRGIAVQTTTIPAPGDDVHFRTRRLVTRYPDISEQLLADNIEHHLLKSWEDACKDLNETNNRKALELQSSHSLLQFAGLAIALTFIATQFRL